MSYWLKAQSRFKGVNTGRLGSLGAKGVFFGDDLPQDKLSIMRARGNYPICRANKINDNDNKHKIIMIAY